ncbi:MAG TPA: AAA family ATPase [Blastocatellia bacterium]|nr:AAA family ATPase [Blastocatellia bacterium]
MSGTRQKKHIVFSPFRLDCAAQRLYRGAEAISLRPKAFEVLQYLSERPGLLVTKDELLDSVWPETSVTDTVLKVCIREIREALGDDPSRPRFIETAHRRGYRFIADIQGLREGTTSTAGAAATPARAHLVERFPAGEIVGRDEEIARLERWLEKALRGERQIVFVTGEPGIGKTTIAEAFLARAAGPDRLIARGQCLEHYGASEAYLPMLEAVSRLCREPERNLVYAVLARHAPTWLAQIPWLIEAGELETLRREMLGSTRDRMLREMSEALEALTADRPLVLVLEDLHWSDYSTLDLISYLARRREPARLMLVGTYRPAELMSAQHPLMAVKQELQLHRLCEELPLRFLSERLVTDYLEARFPGNRFPSDLARLIHQRTDGNPLFIINLVDYFLAKGLIAGRDGGWHLTEALDRTNVGMPDSIRQMIEKQIEGLGRDEQHALETAAVAGVDFSASIVAAALSADIVEVEEMCENLVRRHQFLRSAADSSLSDHEAATRYRFIHALYQNTLYERVPPARRARLHKRIGEQMEIHSGPHAVEIAAELAMHFEKAREHARAVNYFQQAAENASRRFANQETVELSRRGLELLRTLPDSPERSQQELLLQVRFAVALGATEGYGATEVEEAYSLARELCQRSGNSIQLFPVIWGLWRFYLIRSDLRAAGETADHLLELAQSGTDPALSAEAHWAAGVTLENKGDFAEAREHFEQAILLCNAEQENTHLLLYGHDPRVVNRCFNAWALWSLGYPDRAVETAREALMWAEGLRHPETLCYALFFTAWVHQLRRESEKALKYADDAIELAGKYGVAQWAAFGASLHGWALAEQGRVSEGIDQMRRALDLYRSIGSEISRPHFLGLLAEALLKNGETDEAILALTEALVASDCAGLRYYDSELYRLKGEALLKMRGRGDVSAGAEGCFHQGLEIARGQRAISFELRAAVSLARMWKERGRREEARSLLAPIYNRFTEGNDTPDMEDARALLNDLT